VHGNSARRLVVAAAVARWWAMSGYTLLRPLPAGWTRKSAFQLGSSSGRTHAAHDQGTVCVEPVLMLAGGGESCASIEYLRRPGGLFDKGGCTHGGVGPAASCRQQVAGSKLQAARCRQAVRAGAVPPLISRFAARVNRTSGSGAAFEIPHAALACSSRKTEPRADGCVGTSSGHRAVEELHPPETVCESVESM
jgi:hypothetical protein